MCPIADDSPCVATGIFDADEEATRRTTDDAPGVKAGVLAYEVHPV